MSDNSFDSMILEFVAETPRDIEELVDAVAVAKCDRKLIHWRIRDLIDSGDIGVTLDWKLKRKSTGGAGRTK